MIREGDCSHHFRYEYVYQIIVHYTLNKYCFKCMYALVRGNADDWVLTQGKKVKPGSRGSAIESHHPGVNDLWRPFSVPEPASL